ncbi:MAG: FtsX-like permease family protein [Planctomycetaceae bacterium]|nr:FtsX-like permease family protein [Planctomycetaceae bacterium]
MKVSEQVRLALAGMIAPRQRSITIAMVATITVLCATWIAVSGLMDGAERVSEYRVDRRPLSRRILLGDEDLKPLLPSQIDLLEQQVRGELGDRLEFVSPFRVLEWALEDLYEMKGRTINLAPGEDPQTHPLFRDLGLEWDRSDEVPLGLFLCPRFFDKPGFDRKNPPEFLSIDLRRPIDLTNNQVNPIQIEQIPVRGVLKENPNELVYFIIPEADANELLMHPPRQAVRMTPLPNAWLDSNETLTAIEEAAKQFGKSSEESDPAVSDAYVDGKDRLNIELQDRFWSQAEWNALSEHLRSRFPLPDSDDGSPLPLSEIQDSRGGASPKPPKHYPLVGMYFEDPDALPIAADLLSKDPILEGHVDNVIAELIKQLRSFSEAKEVILDTVKLALILLCFVSVSIVQFFRCVIRRSEAGMLKAMGLSNRMLCAIVSWEGACIWLVGTTLGWGIGWIWGRVRSAQLYAQEVEAQLGFAPGVDDIGMLYIATLLTVLLSVQIAAAYLMYPRQPAELLEVT